MDESELNPETRLLLSEKKRLEQKENEQKIRLQALRNKHETKTDNKSRLMKEHDSLKERVSDFISEEDNLLYQKKFLEAEREELLASLNSVSENYDDNMEILEDIMKDVDFIKGEIETLQSKNQILETEIPYKFNDSENLDKRVKVTFFRALDSLEKRINDVQKKAEVTYYRKGET